MTCTVRQVTYQDVKPFVLGIHYARRMPCVQYAYGLFEEDKLLGVVTFGQPASPWLCRGVAGEENRKNVIELNRLVFLPEANGKNHASMLVGKALKMLPRGLFVVSYADWGGWHHVGYVYQATNFLYTGLTKRRTDMFSESGHSRHNCGDSNRRQVRTEKHRYIYLTGNRKKQMAQLRYPVMPYPKGDSQRYDTANPENKLPTKRIFKPRPYQRLIIDHILQHDRSLVWAGMGTGKTVSTLMAVRMLQEIDGFGPALILAPLRVAQSTWPDEIKKWDAFKEARVSVVTGSAAEKKAALDAEADIYCTNYESIELVVEHFKDKPWPFSIIVADESTRLKSFRVHQGGKRAHALGTVAFKSPIFIELTGTPASNGWLDLWGQQWFIDKGAALGRSMRQYQETFFRPIRIGNNAFVARWEPLRWAPDEIMRLIGDHVLKICAEDWFDIKQPIVHDIMVNLPPGAMKVYKEMERDLFVELDGEEIESANAAVKTNKCLQIASGEVYVDDRQSAVKHIHSAKIEAMKSIVAEANGAPILVSYVFRHEADRLMQAFPEARKLGRNPQTIEDWNAGHVKMLLAHPSSCGHGLNLQDGGNILVFFGTGWNLEQHEQIIERIGPTRQAQSGHPRPVFIYNLIAKGTLDEAVQERIKTKRDVLDILMERKKNETG